MLQKTVVIIYSPAGLDNTLKYFKCFVLPAFLPKLISTTQSVIGTLNPPKYQQRLYISHFPRTTKFKMVNNFAVQSITKPSQILRLASAT